MNKITSKEIVRIHPAVMEEMRKVNSRLGALVNENKRLNTELKFEEKRLKALDNREVFVDDMPGKQLPFRYQINIPLVGGSSSPVTGTFNVSKDGPFICRRISASVLVTDAPALTFVTQTYDYTTFIGRYLHLTSRRLYGIREREGSILNFPSPSPQFLYNELIAWAVPDNDPYQPFFAWTPFDPPPPFDFQWEYNDSGGKVVRQDKPISGDILYRQDDDGYVMNNEIFSAGTTVNFIVSPTRAVPVIRETNQGVTRSGPLDIQLKVTFDGFKILQPLQK